jgi:hypothetical protein
VEKDVDIAVICDGDSLFTDRDIMRLLQTLEANPHIDALASMQIRRGNKTMLASIKGQSTAEVGGTPLQVSTAHFGLTVIDLKKLKNVAKIWFWKQWEAAGNTVYLDPQTRIGHMEEMVVMVEPNTYEAVHAYPNEWIDSCRSN